MYVLSWLQSKLFSSVWSDRNKNWQRYCMDRRKSSTKSIRVAEVKKGLGHWKTCAGGLIVVNVVLLLYTLLICGVWYLQREQYISPPHTDQLCFLLQTGSVELCAHANGTIVQYGEARYCCSGKENQTLIGTLDEMSHRVSIAIPIIGKTLHLEQYSCFACIYRTVIIVICWKLRHVMFIVYKSLQYTCTFISLIWYKLNDEASVSDAWLCLLWKYCVIRNCNFEYTY